MLCGVKVVGRDIIDAHEVTEFLFYSGQVHIPVDAHQAAASHSGLSSRILLQVCCNQSVCF